MKHAWQTVKSKSGVTLIELLVVVVILGIIAAVAIPLVTNNQEDTYKNTNQQNLKIVAEAAQRYAIDHGGQLPTKTVGSEEFVDFTKLVGDYLQSQPTVYGSGGSTISADWPVVNGVINLPASALK